ncbi:MAG TPA: hypothetical protein VF901_27655, partial [Bradyrhizobium sp.]
LGSMSISIRCTQQHVTAEGCSAPPAGLLGKNHLRRGFPIRRASTPCHGRVSLHMGILADIDQLVKRGGKTFGGF